MSVALVTCGPAFEPIDDVRCITNHSSGELGAILSRALVEKDFEVACLRGSLATFPPPPGIATTSFGTNSDLESALDGLPRSPDVIFHAAALCDFIVKKASLAKKISSSTQEVTLTLRPARKILTGLRDMFPDALIVGWKLEADGSREKALEIGRAQVAKCRTNACVVNGPAYGAGFGFLTRDDFQHLPDKKSTCAFLASWAREHLRTH